MDKTLDLEINGNQHLMLISAFRATRDDINNICGTVTSHENIWVAPEHMDACSNVLHNLEKRACEILEDHFVIKTGGITQLTLRFEEADDLSITLCEDFDSEEVNWSALGFDEFGGHADN